MSKTRVRNLGSQVQYGVRKIYGYNYKVKGVSKTGSKLVQLTLSVLHLKNGSKY